MDNRFPIKVAVYTSSRISLPLLMNLNTSGNLAGVVLAGNRSAEETQLMAELQRVDIAFCFWQANDIEKLQTQLQRWECNLALCFSFSRILPQAILSCADLGTYNLHPSALPAYRGATPLFWQIKQGVRTSALCLHHVCAELDAGDVVIQQPLPIHPLDTFSSLALAVAAQAPAIASTLIEKILAEGAALKGEAQSGEVSHAPALSNQDVLLNWQSMSALDIQNCARACNGLCGGATFYWRQIPLALLQATPVEAPTFGTKPGTVVMVAEPEGVVVTTVNGAVRLDVIATAEGIFSGLAFAERFGLEAGLQLETPTPNYKQEVGNG